MSIRDNYKKILILKDALIKAIADNDYDSIVKIYKDFSAEYNNITGKNLEDKLSQKEISKINAFFGKKIVNNNSDEKDKDIEM